MSLFRYSLAFLVIAGLSVGIWFYFTKDSRVISKHVKRYDALMQGYTNVDIGNEPQRKAYVDDMEREKKTLIELGYLVEKDFALSKPQITRSNFFIPMRNEVQSANLKKDWSYSFDERTKNLHLSAYKKDIPKWEEIITGLNTQTNR